MLRIATTYFVVVADSTTPASSARCCFFSKRDLSEKEFVAKLILTTIETAIINKTNKTISSVNVVIEWIISSPFI